MSVCRGARDLTFQYPCSCGFRLPAGGTERVRHAPFPSPSRGSRPLCGSPHAVGGTCRRGAKTAFSNTLRGWEGFPLETTPILRLCS
jgi:hypothetical protein